MTKPTFILLFALILCSCKQETKEATPSITELTTVEKIAKAHGYDKWALVETFQFTFGGQEEDPTSGRSWIWKPKTNEVTLMRASDTISYNRNDIDSLALRADRAFINDKFWAILPYQLLHDTGTTISDVTRAIAPVSQDSLNLITVVYGNEGGYTPGDAYDIFFDEDYIIKEWNFRKSNAAVPSMSNTFENYGDFSGLRIAQEHRKSEGDWNLLVRNIKVTMAK